MISRKLMMGLLVVSVGFTQTGCTDEEVAVAVGAGAVIGGAILIGADTRCEAGWKTECRDYYDYWGRLRTECRDTYDSCARLVPKSEFNSLVDEDLLIGAAAGKKVDTSVVNASTWSRRFGLSFSASERLIGAFQEARAGKSEALMNLGFRKEDLRNLMNHKRPAPASVQRVAANLDQHSSRVDRMIVEIMGATRDDNRVIRNMGNDRK